MAEYNWVKTPNGDEIIRIGHLNITAGVSDDGDAYWSAGVFGGRSVRLPQAAVTNYAAYCDAVVKNMKAEAIQWANENGRGESS